MAKRKSAKAPVAKAKKERKVLTAEEKEAKKLKMQEKYASAVDKYVTINQTGKGKDMITTAAMSIRGLGCMVRTSSSAGVSEVFVPMVKIKTKSAWKTLVEIKVKETE